jgi:hypothetical protein
MRKKAKLVAFIDPLEGERDAKDEITIHGRKRYTGSPVCKCFHAVADAPAVGIFERVGDRAPAEASYRRREPPESLKERVDRALYEAKRQGRARFVVA